jgi:hypothetical protein
MCRTTSRVAFTRPRRSPRSRRSCGNAPGSRRSRRGWWRISRRGRSGRRRRRHCGRRRVRDQSAERLRVGDCEALPVVVEVGEHAIRLALESLRPRAELPRAVAALASPSGVEPKVAPACGADPRRWRGGRTVCDYQRGAVPAEKLVDVRREPARIAKFEGVAARRQRLECGLKNIVIAGEVRRQLPEDRRELGRAPQRLEACVHPLHSLHDVAEALEVRQVSAGLDGEEPLCLGLLGAFQPAGVACPPLHARPAPNIRAAQPPDGPREVGAAREHGDARP